MEEQTYINIKEDEYNIYGVKYEPNKPIKDLKKKN